MPLTSAQRRIVDGAQRFTVVIAGRRFGKTHLAVRQLCYFARWPNQTVWYVAPSYRQAKMIAWKKLRQKLIELRWIKKTNSNELTIELKNGSTISLKGADNYDSLRGVGINYLVMDEFADITPEAWYETLRPALSDTGGCAMFIGTPKGMNWAKDLYDLSQEFPREWSSFTFTTLEGGQVPPEEIEAARRTMDQRVFEQEYCASWVNFTGRVYYAFDRTVNVKSYRDTVPQELHIGIDFNVDPLCAVIAVQRGEELYIIDEIRILGSNTDELVTEIRNRYPTQHIICYPDPSGAQRRTSAGGKTDHTILRLAGFQVKTPTRHHPVRDGINAVNARFLSSAGISTMFIDAKCKYTIECLEKHCYKENTSIPNKGDGFDHLTDALRYMVDWLYPIKLPPIQPSVRTFSHKVAKWS